MVNNRTETRHFRCNLLLDYINLFFTFLKIDILLSCVLSQMFIFNEYLMPFYLTSTIYISWMYGIMQRRPTKICRHFAVMCALVFMIMPRDLRWWGNRASVYIVSTFFLIHILSKPQHFYFGEMTFLDIFHGKMRKERK